jgi:hypothetical protein
MANEGAGARRSRKDKEMASQLKKKGVRRTGGICCVCYRPIGNDDRAERHYGAHARGSNS